MVDKSVLEARFSPNVGFYSRNNKLSDSEDLKGINRRRKERSGGEMVGVEVEFFPSLYISQDRIPLWVSETSTIGA